MPPVAPEAVQGQPCRRRTLGLMNEHDILDRVRTLVDQEHDLRARTGAGELDSTEERARLQTLEESLDQCWDLLRQRRARQQAGEDAAGATARPVQQVEGYLQ
jgi:hypothetical protein